eukprot:CAMPEP_0175060064 /NCGR_PEP_ID=MMETSP0052_2-20121109/12783_1 /TAXON_ID=51329 ORGANISM="Polytomella parva, Strain SAG 63-3" /NCGR_SAMPLE_ID=MMETSP0052_2 /ASSEMBLY_ACC=CAM_ASM_000194 /LENGTH=254 /DNA_ID=CAMNT_0016325689 /DNA_START=36 /DNA_END=797 /DNA_ORIENTATION=-
MSDEVASGMTVMKIKLNANEANICLEQIKSLSDVTHSTEASATSLVESVAALKQAVLQIQMQQGVGPPGELAVRRSVASTLLPALMEQQAADVKRLCRYFEERMSTAASNFEMLKLKKAIDKLQLQLGKGSRSGGSGDGEGRGAGGEGEEREEREGNMTGKLMAINRNRSDNGTSVNGRISPEDGNGDSGDRGANNVNRTVSNSGAVGASGKPNGSDVTNTSGMPNAVVSSAKSGGGSSTPSPAPLTSAASVPV